MVLLIQQYLIIAGARDVFGVPKVAVPVALLQTGTCKCEGSSGNC